MMNNRILKEVYKLREQIPKNRELETKLKNNARENINLLIKDIFKKSMTNRILEWYKNVHEVIVHV